MEILRGMCCSMIVTVETAALLSSGGHCTLDHRSTLHSLKILCVSNHQLKGMLKFFLKWFFFSILKGARYG